MEARRWREYNWQLLACVVALLIIGVLAVHSATLTAVTENGAPLRTIFPRQIVYIGVGLAAMTAVTFIDYQLLSPLARPLYIGVVGLLALVLGVGQISEGAQSWIAIGERTFQPSELGKLALILALASFYQRYEERRERWAVQLGALLIAGAPMLLVLVQPDLGTTIVFGTIWLAIAWGSGIRLAQIVALVALSVPALALAWTSDALLDDYQKTRLTTFYYLLTDQTKVDFNAGYNVIQALSAIGTGGWTGAGLTRGLFSQGNYVPVQHTDFIFAVVGEELGFVGGVVLITFQAALLWQALSIASQARDAFGRLIALGVFGMLLSHTLINIGMNLSLLPVTGLPLPLISAGGTFMITTLIAIGLLQSVALRRRRLVF
jgi:rod shape determining protein RodA